MGLLVSVRSSTFSGLAIQGAGIGKRIFAGRQSAYLQPENAVRKIEIPAPGGSFCLRRLP